MCVVARLSPLRRAVELLVFFFFKQKTAYELRISDWSSDVCSSDLTERYLNHVADRFDLRRDIQFSARVAAAVYDDESRSWTIALEDGSRHTARFLVTAVGPLSAPTSPRIPGVEEIGRAE